MSLRKKIAFSIILAGFSCLLLFLIAEVALRVYYKDSVLQFHLYDTYRTHRLNPDYKLRAHLTHLHSKDGFRSDKEFSIQKHPKTIRIIMLGGSALYGLGSGGVYPVHDSLRNNETISSRLESMLNEKLAASANPKKVEVMNAGVIAYQTFQELIYLNQSLLKYKPDWVIHFDGHNDFYGDNPEYSHWEDYTYGSSQLVPHVNQRDFFTPVYLFVRFLGNYSHVFSWSERFTNARMDNHSVSGKSGFDLQYLTSEFSEQNFMAYAKHTFLRSLWQINKLGELEGYKQLVVLQPDLVLEEDKNLSASDLNIKQITLNRMSPIVVSKMKKINPLLTPLLQKNSFRTLNLSTIADADNANLYWDYCHLSPEGSQKTAEKIASYFYPLVSAVR